MIKEIDLKISSQSHSKYFIGKNILKEFAKVLLAGSHSKFLIVSDKKTHSLYGKHLFKEINNYLPTKIFIAPRGEEGKDINVVKKCYKVLLENHFDRTSAIIVIGGGSISDMAGFVAATFMRGIDWYIYPTTLLSQVDASIGGKTGINFSGLKNLIGAFHQPKAVFVDINALKTLSQRQFNSGMAEVIKYAVTLDPTMIPLLEKKTKLNNERLRKLITRSIELKVRIVEKDSFDKTGLREVLNFGHTLGHAIESVMGLKKITHGEAISLGILFAAKLSQQLDYCTHQEVKIISDLLKKYRLPTELKIKRGALMEKMLTDKKRRGGKLSWVLINGIGKTVTNQAVGDKTVKKVLNTM